ncbi:hypothetical protein FRB93_012018 [Tulasnella sp. JGI-2019a]|nr:hypothetical protein FRB93_012018 [Tulasnella sp. JGI-2019a]
MSTVQSTTTRPSTDVKEVVDAEVKEWHFHIYFLQNDAKAKQAALDLRAAVLRLRRDGAFIAVPLFRVNDGPMGPHPIGSYEIWCPMESFASVYSYLALNRGDLRLVSLYAWLNMRGLMTIVKFSIFIHPLTRDEVRFSRVS